MVSELRELFVRDLQKLIAELEAYPDDASVWRVRGDIVNPAGTLALHLIGNLSQFIGADLGGAPFERDREAEFARRDVPRAELIAGLREVSARVVSALDGLDAARLDEVSARQLPGFPEGMTVRYFLIHLYGHLNWHLGQVDYHRRMLD
ncbi:DinB family protein [Deinococcus sp. JMULE3]|uniref:DinB family protein n=1 Tax=Deinococcus sp. JMULE3 TaxID=2518341 RepID=UPI0015772074|nr:DinB family protein [Deinococcus sp. JMULE3]NTY00063.1 DinB family protein [Deinococcus sp. JMULE3]